MASLAPRSALATLVTAVLVTALLVWVSVFLEGASREGASQAGVSTGGVSTGGVSMGGGGVARPAAQSSEGHRVDLRAALGVLRGWDERREQAWARGDAQSLAALYVSGSGAARADLRLLRSFSARGLVVRRMQTQLLAAEVLRHSPEAIRLRVLDRVAGGEVEARGRREPLTATEPVAHTIDLRRVDGRWRVRSVSASGSGPRAAPLPRRGR